MIAYRKANVDEIRPSLDLALRVYIKFHKEIVRDDYDDYDEMLKDNDIQRRISLLAS